MDKTISDIIHKGDAAFVVCYDCENCDPISCDCKEDIKYYKWEKDAFNIDTFVCSSFKQKDS
jgi:hypothetical protein